MFSTAAVVTAAVICALVGPSHAVMAPSRDLQKHFDAADKLHNVTAQPYVKQIRCEDSYCQVVSSIVIYDYAACYTTSTGGSMMVAGCQSGSVVIEQYPMVEDCSGYPVAGSQPTKVCLKSASLPVHFINLCYNWTNPNAARKPRAPAVRGSDKKKPQFHLNKAAAVEELRKRRNH